MILIVIAYLFEPWKSHFFLTSGEEFGQKLSKYDATFNNLCAVSNIQFLIALTSKYLPLSTSSNECVFNHWSIKHVMKILIILLTKFQCLILHWFSQIFSHQKFKSRTKHFFSESTFSVNLACVVMRFGLWYGPYHYMFGLHLTFWAWRYLE